MQPVSTNKGSIKGENPSNRSNRSRTGHDTVYPGVGIESITENINMVKKNEATNDDKVQQDGSTSELKIQTYYVPIKPQFAQRAKQ